MKRYEVILKVRGESPAGVRELVAKAEAAGAAGVRIEPATNGSTLRVEVLSGTDDLEVLERFSAVLVTATLERVEFAVRTLGLAA